MITSQASHLHNDLWHKIDHIKKEEEIKYKKKKKKSKTKSTKNKYKNDKSQQSHIHSSYLFVLPIFSTIGC